MVRKILKSDDIHNRRDALSGRTQLQTETKHLFTMKKNNLYELYVFCFNESILTHCFTVSLVFISLCQGSIVKKHFSSPALISSNRFGYIFVIVL